MNSSKVSVKVLSILKLWNGEQNTIGTPDTGSNSKCTVVSCRRLDKSKVLDSFFNLEIKEFWPGLLKY